MKRIKLTLTTIFSFVSLIASAQAPISGEWSMSMKILGTTYTETLSFDADDSGTVTNTVDLDYRLKMFGNLAHSGIIYTVKGQFEQDGEKLVIKWDSGTYSEVRKEGEFTVDGKYDEQLEKETIEDVDSMVKSFRRDLKGDETFTKVKVSGDKLNLTKPNDKGKNETGIYKRVK